MNRSENKVFRTFHLAYGLILSSFQRGQILELLNQLPMNEFVFLVMRLAPGKVGWIVSNMARSFKNLM